MFILIIISITLLIIGVPFILNQIGGESCYSRSDFPLLEFPIEGGSSNITGFSGFNVSNWGSPGVYHNGMDLQTSGHNWTAVIACAPGKVSNIFQHSNSYTNQTMFSIEIEIAPGWHVTYVLEPGVKDASLIALQAQKINVTKGQCVITGQTIAWLLEIPAEYTHLHFMVMYNEFICPYSISSDAAKAIYESLATTYGKTVCCTDPGQPGCS